MERNGEVKRREEMKTGEEGEKERKKKTTTWDLRIGKGRNFKGMR